MSSNVAALPQSDQVTFPMGIAEVMIEGRIYRSVRKNGKDGPFFVSLVKMPAADKFSSPSTVEIVSPRELGKRGEEVSVTCRVGGYPRTYVTRPSKDNPDGETVYTADIRLHAIG